MSADFIARGYATEPSLAVLRRMSEDELSGVSGFTVKRKGFGSVRWLGRVDVRGIKLDEIIEITYLAVEVYTDKSSTPPRGTQLNRPSIITIEDVSVDTVNGDLAFLVDKLKETVREFEGTFINYDPDTKVWEFKVEHFTRYGLDVDSIVAEKVKISHAKELEEDEVSFPQKLDLFDGIEDVDDAVMMVVEDKDSPAKSPATKKDPADDFRATTIPTTTPMDASPTPAIQAIQKPVHPIPLHRPKTNFTTSSKVASIFASVAQSCKSKKYAYSGRRSRIARPSWGPRGQLVCVKGTSVLVSRVASGGNPASCAAALEMHMSSRDDLCKLLHGYVLNWIPSSAGAHDSVVWTLVNAIWGWEVGKGASPTSDETRRYAVSAWLRGALQTLGLDRGNSIPELLSRNDVAAASEAASARGDARLAMLLSSAASAQTIRSMRAQLGAWTASREIDFIDGERVALMEMLSQSQPIEPSSSAWLAAFGMLLWHKTPPMAPLRAAVDGLADALPQEPSDATYHLLRLASSPDGAYDMRKIVAAGSSAPTPLCHNVGWHLHQVLARFGACAHDLDSRRACQLSVGYISQLEALGMWQWAAYVASVMPCDDASRSRLVRSIISRHADASDSPQHTPQEAFLASRVGVDAAEISAARALRYKYEHRLDEEIAWLAQAKKWDEWHAPTFSKLAPKLVMSSDLEVLVSVVEYSLEHGMDPGTCPSWDEGVGLMFNYARLRLAADAGGFLPPSAQRLVADLLEVLRHPSSRRSEEQREVDAEMAAWLMTRVAQFGEQALKEQLFARDPLPLRDEVRRAHVMTMSHLVSAV